VKHIFAAAAVLSVACMAADAQVANDKTAPTAPPRAPPTETLCDPAAARLDCGTQTQPPTTSPTSGRPLLSALTPEPDQTLPADFHARRLIPPGPSDKHAHSAPSEERDKTSLPAGRFQWRAALNQSLLFLSIQHSYALTQPKTRRDLGGNFLKDYARSVRSLHGWGDGGRFFTNYVAHPMQGSLLGFVQVQNDPSGSRRRFGGSSAYWRSRMKALAWSAAWSTQFEIGPVSQASIGNVGLHGKQTYVDLVMTPTAGLGLLLTEDALDRYVIERIERRTTNRYVRILSRMALNPTRTGANLLRFKKPWHRDAGLR
jgi:hypothetical protein